METLEFKIKLPANKCMNLKIVHLCLPIQIKKNTLATANIDANMITLIIFLLKDIKTTYKFYQQAALQIYIDTLTQL